MVNEIKKDLYKSKNMAKFSHYISGNLYYKIEVMDDLYQFPIKTIEGELDEIKLSEDLGQTTFFNEIKGSELIRWITKAIKEESFLKIN